MSAQRLNLHLNPAKLSIFLVEVQAGYNSKMLHKTNSEILCMECKEAIYNPLCPSCLARQMKVWLENKPEKIRKEVEIEIEKILGMGKLVNSMACIACKKNRVFLCPYCFTESVYKKLRELNSNNKIMEEFMVYFNFDFEHSGYYRDAETLGVV